MFRRSFIAGFAAALCAPVIIRTTGLLMPVRQAMISTKLVDKPIFENYGWFGKIAEEALKEGVEAICAYDFSAPPQNMYLDFFSKYSEHRIIARPVLRAGG